MSQETHPFYVTTPIYYVNDRPHIGHAYTTILADVLARYHRLLGDPTFFLTGTDEHGQKVAKAAAQLGISPQQQADQTVVRFQDLWRKLDITHDDFIRTTEPRHKTIVQRALADLYARGEIYQAEYEGWYSVTEERFFTEKELVDGLDPIGKRPVERLVEKNYFFRMSKYQAWLVEYIESHPEFIQPDFRRNETLGFLRQPLGDLCISRPKARLAWGIELPFDPDYVCYVWFDALINYISAVGYLADEAKFRQWWPANYHLIGKDILTTHSVYWPTMLKAMGLPLPRSIFAHGWWLVGRDKMSKSAGNVVDPMAVCDRYGVDAFRYFLMAEMTLGQDASFTEELFVERYNNDLANGVGNMLSRVLKMVQANFGGLLPAPGPEQDLDRELREHALRVVAGMPAAILDMKLDRGLETVAGLVRACNQYFERTAPWTLRGPEQRERLGTVLYTAAEALRLVSGLLYPVLPGKMTEMRRALGIAAAELVPSLSGLQVWGGLQPGSRFAQTPGLFPKIEPPAATAKNPAPQAEAAPVEATPKAGKPAPPAAVPGVVETVDLEHFGKVKLRVARILAAERVEGADKLLKLQLDLGGEPRQIVAGIAKHYAPENLPGRLIVIVANLKPAKIRGIESNGMLLAASTPDKSVLRLLGIDGDVPPGASIG